LVPVKRLSPSEFEIMKACWTLGKATGREVCDEVLKHRVMDYTNVHVLLRRIAEKGYLEITMKDRKSKYYRPTVRERTVLKREIKRFLDEVVGHDEENRELLRQMLDS